MITLMNFQVQLFCWPAWSEGRPVCYICTFKIRKTWPNGCFTWVKSILVFEPHNCISVALVWSKQFSWGLFNLYFWLVINQSFQAVYYHRCLQNTITCLNNISARPWWCLLSYKVCQEYWWCLQIIQALAVQLVVCGHRCKPVIQAFSTL